MATSKKTGKPSLAALAERYNAFAAELGEKTVNRFSDRKSAERRLSDIKKRARAAARKNKSTGTGTGRGRKRAPFNFPGSESPNTLREGTMRKAIFDALIAKKGLTFEQIVDVVRDYDAEKGVKRDDQHERAYGATRLLNIYAGYGLSEDDNGVIRIVK